MIGRNLFGWPLGRMLPLTYEDPSTFSGKNDKRLRDIIQQKHIPGSKAARAHARGMSKGKKRR